LVSIEFSYFEGGCYGFVGLGLWFYLKSLSKLLVCGADDIVFNLDLCLYLFVFLDLYFVSFGLILLFLGCTFYYK
jgi:hypothetical protein